MRQSAWVAIVALLLNITLPFATVVGGAWPTTAVADQTVCHTEPADGSTAEQQPAAPQNHGHHAVCPLCVLLAGHSLAPLAGDFVLLRAPAPAVPLVPVANIEVRRDVAARPQVARAPPVLI